jgi:hypothetical protein
LQTNLEKLKSNRYLVFSLLASGFPVLIANFLGKHIALITTDILFLPLSGMLVAVSIMITTRFKGKGSFGTGYLCFCGFATMWFVAELIWAISELSNHFSPFPQLNDYLYLAGYPLLLAFTFYYLKPVESAISKKMLGLAALTSLTFLTPTFYTVYSYNPNASLSQMIWAGSYPIADAILLFPTVIGMMLFFKGDVSLLWSLMFFAILLNIIADSGFFYLDVDKSYYSGSPIDILYLWAYVLFSFGLYSHIKVFKKPKMKSYGNLDELK